MPHPKPSDVDLKNISHLVIMGDSLSDRATLSRKDLLGVIPMGVLSGLNKHTAFGRFTNGFAWSDFLSAYLANRFLIAELKSSKPKSQEQDLTELAQDSADLSDAIITKERKKRRFALSSEDIADGLIANDKQIQALVDHSYTLENDLAVQYKGLNFIRTYAEGGLTSSDYSCSPTINPMLCVSRLILANLAQKRKNLLAYDAQHELSKCHKAHTLVMEWSGGNDFITVNSSPSKEIADRTLKARIENAEILIRKGYRHFILFNLPDLSLTPRFQAKSIEEQKNAKQWCIYFNEQLAKECKRLNKTYRHCSVEVFDVSSIFSEVYNDPSGYGFEVDKLTKPYTQSKDFKVNKDGTSPAKGYMFWDDIHPTADMHANLVEKVLEHITREYHFKAPREESIQKEKLAISATSLRAAFIVEYKKTLEASRAGWLGFFRASNINYEQATLVDILRHALDQKGHRTRDVITKLQWIDDLGKLNLNIPALKKAMESLDEEREKKALLPLPTQ